MDFNEFKDFKKGTKIVVSDKMQKNYSYILEHNPGKNLDFKPYYTPLEMLKMGVFEGHYMTDCTKEFPKNWFVKMNKDEA